MTSLSETGIESASLSSDSHGWFRIALTEGRSLCRGLNSLVIKSTSSSEILKCHILSRLPFPALANVSSRTVSLPEDSLVLPVKHTVERVLALGLQERRSTDHHYEGEHAQGEEIDLLSASEVLLE